MNDRMHHAPSEKTKWLRFFGMIATATVTMFFLMYQLVYEGSHLTFSMNRLISSLVSGSVMVIIMLLFMWNMYRDKSTKMMVLVAALIAFVGLLFINRGQALIDDEHFMKSMIPHHSIAIHNARKGDISDPRVRKLADEIIEAQVREIAEMKLLLEDIERNGKQGDGTALPPVPAELTPELYDKARERLEKPVTPELRDAVTVER
ncbi:DUF305 domain-containing protein [Sphingomicrobium lutaoense]|uniref:DUF305 domain-containing protein n=1 Tax=Sphingomicrobium lutaoense TaxID=515949 RepID=A0A839Z4Y3_9SPHN|nr:DUF305 domain-containing protein [Sphingomicrobium lutaoense]MBB3764933.1 hypothetical protein [Sphingomicrobium lutaoense]